MNDILKWALIVMFLGFAWKVSADDSMPRLQFTPQNYESLTPPATQTFTDIVTPGSPSISHDAGACAGTWTVETYTMPSLDDKTDPVVVVTTVTCNQ